MFQVLEKKRKQGKIESVFMCAYLNGNKNMSSSPTSISGEPTSINSLSTLGTLSSEVVNYDSSQFDSLTPGYLLGWFKNYRLLERLGEGGMGQTWLAEELSGDEAVQKVVVKVLSKELCGNAEAMEEVRRVFDLTGKLRHPNICATLGMKKDPVFGWILVMDHADGGTLSDWFHAQPNHENGLPLEKVLPILRPIAEALDFAHSEGILHRDVKPGNIMFSGRKPILIDFGIAARIRPENVTNATQSFGRSATGHASSSSGTPQYMAPEQMLGQPQTGRADQYALAMVLYELLAGKLPFICGNLMGLIYEKARFSPVNPKFPAPVNAALSQALAEAPEKRFTNCRAFFDALATPSPAPRPQPKPVQKPVPAPVQNSQPTEITVPDDVRTLAEAYDRIPAGGKIIVRPGTHKVPKTVEIKKDVTVHGDLSNPESVILKGGKDPVFKISAGYSAIKGLSFQNDGDPESEYSSAVQFEAPSGLLENCIFTSQGGDGLEVCAKNSAPTVRSCIARNCGQFGIAIFRGASGTFTDCEASGNALAGIAVRDSGTNPTVENCRFMDSKKSSGIVVYDGASGTFTDCEAIGNAYSGIQVRDSGTNPTVEKCRFTDSKESCGILVWQGASGTFTDCEAIGNALDGIQVRDSGTNPTVEKCRFTDGKQNGIFVYDGASGTFTYCESSGNAYFGIAVRDSGTNPTVEKCRSTNNQQAGIVVYDGASGTFTDCESSGNALSGIEVRDSGTNPTVENCRFTDGKQSGIYIWQGASGTFTYCEASGNAYSGIEVRDSGTDLAVEKCRFTDGKQNGIFVHDGASGTFTYCEASGNALSGIEVRDSGTDLAVTGCWIQNNKGAGVKVIKASGTFKNNKLSGNAKAWDVGWFSSVVREGNEPNR